MYKYLSLKIIAAGLIISVISGIILTNPKNFGQTSVTKSGTMEATYKCWTFNVGGSTSKCTSPPIVLKKDGSYTMSSEKGTYNIAGEKIYLSESKLRGAGTFKESRSQIIFEYTYNNLKHVVRYLTKDDTGENGPVSNVVLTLIFPKDDDRGKWISSVSLFDGENYYDAIAQSDGNKTVKADFRTVPVSKSYLVIAGTDTNVVGEINLNGAKKQFKQTINVPVEIEPTKKIESQSMENDFRKNIKSKKTTTKDSEKTQPKKDPSIEKDSNSPPLLEIMKTSDPSKTTTGKKCNPAIPSYSQPGCI